MVKKRVLVVDDVSNFTKLLKLALEDQGGYEVQTVNEAKKAVEEARSFKPNLIMLDSVMPDMKGEDVARELAADDELKNIPIVFLTATVSREDIVQQGSEMNGYPVLSKPASVDEILNCIKANIS